MFATVFITWAAGVALVPAALTYRSRKAVEQKDLQTNFDRVMNQTANK
jgi:hypothetical protein